METFAVCLSCVRRQTYPSIRGRTIFRAKDRLALTKGILDSFFDMGVLQAGKPRSAAVSDSFLRHLVVAWLVGTLASENRVAAWSASLGLLAWYPALSLIRCSAFDRLHSLCGVLPVPVACSWEKLKFRNQSFR